MTDIKSLVALHFHQAYHRIKKFRKHASHRNSWLLILHLFHDIYEEELMRVQENAEDPFWESMGIATRLLVKTYLPKSRSVHLVECYHLLMVFFFLQVEQADELPNFSDKQLQEIIQRLRNIAREWDPLRFYNLLKWFHEREILEWK